MLPDKIEEPATQLIEVSDLESIERICRFRARVWNATPGTAPNAFPDGYWRDAVDNSARHWICRAADGRLLAAARMVIANNLGEVTEPEQYRRYGLVVDGTVAAPDRVVVASEAQRQGLAGRLLDRQHQAARDAGAACAVRQASPRMTRLLARRGWLFLGPADVDPRFPGTVFTVSIYVFDPSRVRYSSRTQGAVA